MQSFKAHWKVKSYFNDCNMCRLALIPLALCLDEPGKEIEAPMAIVILGRLFTSTALNMIVVPGLFY